MGIQNGIATNSLPATQVFGGERQRPVPASEALPPTTRRQSTLEYKRRILEEAQRCRETNNDFLVGALLRREGLYSSHLAAFKAQLANPPAKRGRKPQDAQALLQAQESRKLRKENARLQRRLAQAELIIDVQQKSIAAPGDPPRGAAELRERLMNGAKELAGSTSVTLACVALGLPRCDWYRRSNPQPQDRFLPSPGHDLPTLFRLKSDRRYSISSTRNVS